MSISARLCGFLSERGASYEVCTHDHSSTSAQTARLAHIAQHQLAKSVLLEDDAGCVMAVIPADARVHVGDLARVLGRSMLHLSDEERIKELFSDCEPGAVPALGMAWGVETVVDDELDGDADVYIEGGDHEALLRMSGAQFRELIGAARRAHFCRHPGH